MMMGPELARSDRRLFLFTAIIFALLVFAGFARTFYLHPLFHLPAPSLFLQFHGALMTGWIVLFLVQALLISNHRLVWHKQLGVVGLVLAALIIPIGCVATLAAAQREIRAHSAFVSGQLNVLGLELMQMLLFACFVSAAALLRKRGDSHKRLMLVATLCILPNAVVRLSLLTNIAFLTTNFGILCVWTLFVLSVVAIDTSVGRRLHATLGWSASIAIGMLYVAWLGSRTSAWDQFWVRTLG